MEEINFGFFWDFFKIINYSDRNKLNLNIFIKLGWNV